jgi:hypothetical protein
VNEAVQQQTDQALDLHQVWFDLALQGHQLLQKQTDAMFAATREITSAQRDSQQAFAKMFFDAALRRNKS